MRILVAILLVAVAAGCAPDRRVPQETFAYDTPTNRDRLLRVVPRLAIDNADLCRDTIGVFVTSAGQPACDLSVAIGDLPGVNAATDSTNILISPGLMAFVETDDELAALVGHELGHIIREHVQWKRAGAIAGAMVDGFARGRGVNTGGAFQTIGATAFNPAREREADRWGVFMAARAGFDPMAAARFWSRMPTSKPGLFATHPPSSERAADMTEWAKELYRDGVRGKTP